MRARFRSSKMPRRHTPICIQIYRRHFAAAARTNYSPSSGGYGAGVGAAFTASSSDRIAHAWCCYGRDCDGIGRFPTAQATCRFRRQTTGTYSSSTAYSSRRRWELRYFLRHDGVPPTYCHTRCRARFTLEQNYELHCHCSAKTTARWHEALYFDISMLLSMPARDIHYR